MKSAFATTWKRSKQPRKQRKYLAMASHHIQGKFLGAHLSLDLRKKYGTRSVRVRKGDKVKVMRGNFKGQEGVVDRVSKGKIFVTKIELNRRDGSKSQIPLTPSNVMIMDLNLDDKKRLKNFRKAKPKAEPEAKPAAKKTPEPKKTEKKPTGGKK